MQKSVLRLGIGRRGWPLASRCFRVRRLPPPIPRCCRAICRPGTCSGTADIVVKAVMVGLAIASVVTWTVALAKAIDCSPSSAMRQRRRGLGERTH